MYYLQQQQRFIVPAKFYLAATAAPSGKKSY
jgi:hypothetical protein